MSNAVSDTRNDSANSRRNDGPKATSSAWKDLPRRLLTVTLGVPSIILLLRHSVTSWLFFQGAHLLCLIEWRALVPSDESGDPAPKNNDPSKTNAAPTPPKENFSRASLAEITAEETSSSFSPLRECMFYLFCFFSALITMLPTSKLPLGLISYGVSVRLIPHLPAFQSSRTTNTTILKAVQHYQFGLLYLSTGFHFILQISEAGGHIGNLLFIVWMSDTGALIAGRLMKGKANNATKEVIPCGAFSSFLKSISPGKTLPGLLGAIVTGLISALIYPISLPSSAFDAAEQQCHGEIATAFATIIQLSRYFRLPLCRKAALGLILSVTGILGDLAESSVKRLSKKKDSGGLLPGHGGVVDRFDSLLFAGVVYYYWVLA